MTQPSPTGSRRVLTGEDVAVLDRNAAALGVPRAQLMESSGNAVAREARDLLDGAADVAGSAGSAGNGDDTPPSVAVVCGRGNNGGDGFVAARFLDDLDVTVHLLGDPERVSTAIARRNLEAIEAAEVDVRAVGDSRDLDLGGPDLVVDAMLGTGVSGPLREPERTAAAAIDATDAAVLSVDVPSGLDAATGDRAAGTVTADRVVTFHDAKPGLGDGPEAVTVADIGIPTAAERLVGPGDLQRLSRPGDSHKGDFGRVTVIGGGPYAGAPALAGRAALRAGADLAYLAVPSPVAETVQGYSPDLIVEELPGDRLDPEHVDGLLEATAERDVVVLGPGLGESGAARDAAARFLADYEGRAVVDADALAAVPDLDTAATLVCTPHRGELREMGGPAVEDAAADADAIAEFAAALGQTLLVKGPQDVVTDGTVTRRNRTGNPGMTVGGTGDVLAGLTAALLAVLPPRYAAAIAAYANGAAGDRLVEERGYGLLASDLPDALPAVLWERD